MSNGKDNSEDEVLMILLIGAMVAGIGFLAWYLAKPQITDAIRQIRLVEMKVARQFVPDNYAVKYADMKTPLRMDGMQSFLQTAETEKVTTAHLAKASDMALRPLRVPFAVLILLLAAFIYKWGPHTKFKTKHSLETLIKVQAQTFPYITPMIDFNPAKMPNRAPGDPVPLKLPLFAEALSPEEWVAWARIPMTGKAIDEAAASEAFAKQLGARYESWQKLPVWLQVLLAAFGLRAARKRNESDVMLGRLSKCWTSKRGLVLGKDPKLVSEARAFLRSKAAEPMLKVMRQHAWVATAMVRALDHARSQGGVLSPGQFVWLRGHNRDLWYPLNNMGRQAFHPEALGAMAHFKLEKQTQRPVPVPKMDGAVAALKAHFLSDHARPIPQVDYGHGKVGNASSPKGRKAGIMKPAA